MILDDLKKLATGSTLLNLDRLIIPRLLKLIYLAGLLAIGVLAFNHIFFSFRFGLGSGIWGLMEAAIFSLLAFLGIRIVCELLMVFFKANEQIVRDLSLPQPNASLIDDVRDAIEDLVSDEVATLAAPHPPAQTTAKPKAATARAKPKATTRRAPTKKPTGKTARRTTRRTAKPKD